MAEFEPGHPDELVERLTNWLNQVNEPVGSLPPGVTPAEWAVRNFIDMWHKPIRDGLDAIEASLNQALTALASGDAQAATFEIQCSLQTLAEDVRNELGLYDWNREA